MNLIDQLGADYVDQFYKQALFIKPEAGRLYRYGRHIDNNTIECMTCKLDGGERWTNVLLTNNDFMSMDVFAWPKLGYRNFRYRDTMLTYYVSTSRSAMRGLKDDFINFNGAPITRVLGAPHAPREWMSQAQYVRELFRPTFVAFDEGMRGLRAGTMPSFALSEDLCISMSSSGNVERVADVLYKERVIGSVIANDVVLIPSKIAKRASSIRLFQGRIQ